MIDEFWVSTSVINFSKGWQKMRSTAEALQVIVLNFIIIMARGVNCFRRTDVNLFFRQQRRSKRGFFNVNNIRNVLIMKCVEVKNKSIHTTGRRRFLIKRTV